MVKLWKIILISVLIAVGLSAQEAEIAKKLEKKISANFVRTSITDVLRLLASQNNLNMVVGSGVKGLVTIQLNNVALEDALSIILKSHGYHFVVQNGILLVKPFSQAVNGELESRVFHLKYLDGYQVIPTLTPLLSEKGKIEPLVSEKMKDANENRSDMLLVTDVWENLREIEKVISDLDKKPEQLIIEVKLVETLLGGERQVGFNWPKKVTATMTGGEVTAPITKSTSGAQQQRRLSGWYQFPEVNPNLTLGVLTVDELEATLSLLAQDNNSRLVSSPKIATINNHKAVIDVGTTIPVPQVSRGVGGDLISYQEKQVSMKLEVIPRINEDNVITLTVHPLLEEIIGYTGPADYPQPITSRREVTTNVTVREGESIAIGGLIKESKKKIVDKIWLLGDIPLLGYFFRHTTTKTEKSDLLIFITPKILKDTDVK